MAGDVQIRAGRREWSALVVLALPTLLVSIDIFVLLLALPSISAELEAGGTQQLWLVDVYGFMVAGLLVTMGNLGDRIGHRRLLLIGVAAFGVASVAAAYSTGPETLIAARALLGVAGAALGPTTLALISNMFRDEKERGLAISVWAACFSIGAIVGPVIGGVMLEHFWWGSVFLLAVPPMAITLVLAPLLLPESTGERGGRVDLGSVALSLLAVLPFVYGVKELARHGWRTGPALALAVGVFFAVRFLRRQRRLADPLLDLSLFRSGAFNTALVSMFFYTMLTGTTMMFITQFFPSVAGMSPMEAGLGLLPGLALGILSLMAAPVLSTRVPPFRLVAGGLLLTVAGLAMVALSDGAAGLVAGFAVWCVGGGPLLTLGTGLVVGSVPPEKSGTASALSQISNEFGYAVGIATVGTVGTVVYRARLPHDMPAQVAEPVRESLARAVAAAEGLPGGAGGDLAASARAAFTDGLHAVAAVGAVLLLGVALLNARTTKLPVPGQALAPRPVAGDPPTADLQA
ncbi:MFS transporter [Planomonospora corallina]|uniref:MFS transporter n=1 Tax=Planomonospora corallina TaxID=1806052 RepID=A0ABV8HZ28_9ACTN